MEDLTGTISGACIRHQYRLGGFMRGIDLFYGRRVRSFRGWIR